MSDLHNELGGATNVLLGAPSMSQGTADVCTDLLAQRPPEEVSALWVSFTKPATECLDRWRAGHDADPASYGFIVVGDTVGGSPDTGDINPNAIQRVTNASDLTGIGIKVGEFVSGRDEQIVVCVDSLTSLLQYVDLETAYEFLHAPTGQLCSVGAVAH
jgi:hypothetical protein